MVCVSLCFQRPHPTKLRHAESLNRLNFRSGRSQERAALEAAACLALLLAPGIALGAWHFSWRLAFLLVPGIALGT